jgi:acetyltransferase-like isoleucine patch superfamily enzyme
MSILHTLYQIVNPYKAALKDGLNVGQGVSIVGRSKFGTEPYLITLEDNVRVSFDVTFITHDGGTWAFRDQEKYRHVFKYGRIRVGERSFIGCKSIIMPGVTIGKRCVIGAGSLVTKDVPDGMVACGVPARVVMSTEEYAEKCLARMKPYDEAEYFRDKRAFLAKWL